MEKELRRMNIKRYIVSSIILIIVGSSALSLGVMNGFRVYPFLTGLVCLTVAPILIFNLLTKDPLRLIKKYLQKNPEIKMEHLEWEFNNATKFGPRVWVGQRWTIFLNSYGAPDIIEHEKVVWAYRFTVNTNGYRKSIMEVYDVEMKHSRIPLKRNNLETLLQMYHQKFGIIIGYNDDYVRMINTDYNQLINIRYSSVK